MFAKLFKPFAMKVAGGIILSLVVAFAVVVWRADAISADRERLRNTLATERATHAVTRQSLATLENELTRMVRDGELRAQRLAEARESVREDTAALREQAARVASQRASGGDPCVTPDAVRGATGL